VQTCDVLIVGGGPAGSSCAWRLRRAGADVVVLDRARFPRDKVCAGWITPPVVEALELDREEYAARRVLQPIRGFEVSRMPGAPIASTFDEVVSYGIRRCEFDDYLLRRSGARLLVGSPLATLRRDGSEWIANGEIRARAVVGAGGHFCPVARLLNPPRSGDPVVAAQEIEFRIDHEDGYAIAPDVPELYFCRDLRGYGWCFRKGAWLNVGLGRLDTHRLADHVRAFVAFLETRGRVAPSLPRRWAGHAYLLAEPRARRPGVRGALLAGDAAGLAFPQSGEGIRPAVESGLLAADTIVASDGALDETRVGEYARTLASRYGAAAWERVAARVAQPAIVSALAGPLLAMPWFVRRVVLERWFLRANVPATGGAPCSSAAGPWRTGSSATATATPIPSTGCATRSASR
jgi:geranylgeranyl reductase family protein